MQKCLPLLQQTYSLVSSQTHTINWTNVTVGMLKQINYNFDGAFRGKKQPTNGLLAVKQVAAIGKSIKIQIKRAQLKHHH